MSEIVIIGKYQHNYEAEVARAALEAEGIEVAILDNSGSVLPSLQMLMPLRLAVNAADAELAREILANPNPLPADPSQDDV